MGQAKMKQAFRGNLASAMQKVVGASSDSFGADCAVYAVVGAIAMQKLGFSQAVPVAGSAIWRVGPGDGDVISHALSAMQPGMGLYASKDAGAKSVMFHAWIECDTELIDFTTFSLHQKAAMLDAADGGKTEVKWAPGYIWNSRASCIGLHDVAQSFAVGVYSYEREPMKEAELLKWKDEVVTAEVVADRVVFAFGLLQQGHQVKVLGVDPLTGAISSPESIEADAMSKGLVRRSAS